MSIIKRRPSRFTTLARHACENLGADALAVLAYLAGKPDNWEVSVRDISSRFGWGEYKTRNAMKELVAAGYAARITVRDDNGRISGRRYDVANEPIFAESSDAPSLQKFQPWKNQSLQKLQHIEKTESNRKQNQKQKTEEAEHADACSGPVAPSGDESEKERKIPPSQERDETHENADTHEIKAMNGREDKRTSFLNSSFRGKVPDDWLELAQQHGLSKREAAIEADKFEMWFRNGKGKRKLRTERGWRLTWRKWIAKHDSYTPERIAPLFDGEKGNDDWG